MHPIYLFPVLPGNQNDGQVLSEGHKNYFKDWCQEMAMLSKGRKPDNSEPHNSLKHSFTNIGGFSLDFVKCKSFLESNSLDIHSPDALCVTNVNASI